MPSQPKKAERKRKIKGDVQPEKVQKTLLKWVLVVLVGVAVYTLCLLLMPENIGTFKPTVAARLGSVEAYLSVTGAIVRDERVVITPVSGIVNYLVDDMSKVAPNTPVVQITDSEVLKTVKPNVDKFKEEINSFIRQCELDKIAANNTLNDVRTQISSKKSQRRAFLNNNDAKGVNRMDQDIETLTAKEKDLLNEIKSLEEEIASSSEMLKDAVRTVESSVGTGLASIKTFSSSIVSRSLDGLESVLRPGNPELLEVDYEKLQANPYEVKDNDSVAAGQAVFKEIQNFKTQVLVRAKFDRYDPPVKGAKIGMRFPKFATEVVQCVVEDVRCVDEEENIWAIFVTLDRFATSLTSVRFTDVDVVLSTTEGMIIPKSCVTEKDGQTGVYALKKNDFVFTTVEVLNGNDEEVAVKGVKEGDKLLLKP